MVGLIVCSSILFYVLIAVAIYTFIYTTRKTLRSRRDWRVDNWCIFDNECPVAFFVFAIWPIGVPLWILIYLFTSIPAKIAKAVTAEKPDTTPTFLPKA